MIFQNIKTHYRQALLNESAEIQAAVKRLTDYYYNYWIDRPTTGSDAGGFQCFWPAKSSSTLMEPDVSKQIQMLIITSIHKSI